MLGGNALQHILNSAIINEDARIVFCNTIEYNICCFVGGGSLLLQHLVEKFGVAVMAVGVHRDVRGAGHARFDL